MITIDQLLESVDLEFEPRWVTKDSDTEEGLICAWSAKPTKRTTNWQRTDYTKDKFAILVSNIKVADFENKPWQECIYEVPRKTTGKIEKLGKLNVSSTNMTMNQSVVDRVVNTLNQVIDAVNELKGAKND